MAKKTLRDLNDLSGKRVLIRVDFNVPLNDDGSISNDRRIRAALPTIRHVLDAGAVAICMSHLGRPKGDPKQDAIYRMDRVGQRLSELLGKPVKKLDQVVGPEVTAAVQTASPGSVILLENLRFHPGEQKGDEAFAAELAKIGDVYVNDAFGTCHRTDASMYAVPKLMTGKPRVVGFLVAKELEILERLLTAPARPFVGVLGGAKVSDKIGFIKRLLERVDRVLIGGAMTYTFMQALGQSIGNSRVEADKLDVARELLSLGQGKITLPVDHLIADRLDASAATKIVEGPIPDGWIAVDIGPKTIAQYADIIGQAKMVVWNGPMGKFEDEPFSRGTRAIAEAMAGSSAITVVGGGETAEAVEAFGLDNKMTHVSTGGGAFLEYVEGTPFKALSVLDDADERKP
ncbi:MAG: phosphoglycerate kinase [Gemmatales bacterium]|nr:phosphoglycerate kinase [Gemmatales bacterium]MDW8385757.1 phosphoglycerate kinase [Gemmatales bacterium]